jgi:hypothetical protein
MPLPAWSIYKLAPKRQWLGIVEAPDAKAAIEAAAREFKTDARRLLAVWQRPLPRLELRRCPFEPPLGAHRAHGSAKVDRVARARHGFDGAQSCPIRTR